MSLKKSVQFWKEKINDFMFDLCYPRHDLERPVGEKQRMLYRQKMLQSLIRDCEYCIVWSDGIYHTYLLTYEKASVVEHISFDAWLLMEVALDDLHEVAAELAEWSWNYGDLDEKLKEPYNPSWLRRWKQRLADREKRQEQKKKQPRIPRRLKDEPLYDNELEFEFKDRVPHRRGWGRLYRPTRATWHRHDDNRCWKNNKCRKQYLTHLD